MNSCRSGILAAMRDQVISRTLIAPGRRFYICEVDQGTSDEGTDKQTCSLSGLAARREKAADLSQFLRAIEENSPAI